MWSNLILFLIVIDGIFNFVMRKQHDIFGFLENIFGFLSPKEADTHVADGLPLPLRIATRIWVRFLESLYPCEHEMSIKKLFYHPVSELPAKSYSQFGPSRLDWPYCLGGNSETGWWKFFFMLVSCSYGYRLSKKCTLIFVAIRKGRGSPTATCVIYGQSLM